MWPHGVTSGELLTLQQMSLLPFHLLKYLHLHLSRPRQFLILLLRSITNDPVVRVDESDRSGDDIKQIDNPDRILDHQEE